MMRIKNLNLNIWSLKNLVATYQNLKNLWIY